MYGNILTFSPVELISVLPKISKFYWLRDHLNVDV